MVSHYAEEKKQDTNEKKTLKRRTELITIKSRKMLISIGEGRKYDQEGACSGAEFMRG